MFTCRRAEESEITISEDEIRARDQRELNAYMQTRLGSSIEAARVKEEDDGASVHADSIAPAVQAGQIGAGGSDTPTPKNTSTAQSEAGDDDEDFMEDVVGDTQMSESNVGKAAKQFVIHSETMSPERGGLALVGPVLHLPILVWLNPRPNATRLRLRLG